MASPTAKAAPPGARWWLAGLSLLATMAVAACAAGGPSRPTAAPVGTSAAPPTAAPPAGAAPRPAAEADLETTGDLDSPDGKLRVSGRGGLLLSLRQAANAPAPPPGWRFLLPVFDVTAQDRQRRPVAELREALSLRFDVPAPGPATVLVHRSGLWQIVPSERETGGGLTARVDHLTPYAAGAPARGASQGAPAPQPSRAATPAAPATVPTRAATPIVAATAGAAPASSASAAEALEAAVKTLKGKTVRAASAAGYTGSVYVAIPATLQDTLGSALAAGGTGYYGLYNAVNEAVAVQAGGAQAAGTLTLLLEPKTSTPADAAEARGQLATLFPGVTVSLTQVQTTTPETYLFYGAGAGVAASLGYLSYEGVPLAFALAGTGSAQPLVPRAPVQ